MKNHTNSFADPFPEDSLMENEHSYKNSNGMQDMYGYNDLGTDHI